MEILPLKYMKIDKFTTLRVIFVPDENLSTNAIRLAKEVSKRGKTYFIIDDKSHFTHLTVYHAEYPSKNKKALVGLLENFAMKQEPLKLTFNKFCEQWAWFGLDFNKTKEIYEAHKKLVNVLNPLREGHIREKYLEEIKNSIKYSKVQKKYISQYGYSQVMSEYHPHLTLNRFVNEEIAEKVCKDFNNRKVSIKDSLIKEIALVKSGEYGTVTGYIKRFKLKG